MDLTIEQIDEIRQFINKNSITIRGEALTYFTVIELFMNETIRFYSHKYSLEYKEKITMDLKLDKFIECVERFEQESEIKMALVKLQIRDIVEKRNMLAHWILDVREPQSIKLFSETNSIRLLKYSNGKIVDEKIMNSQKAYKLTKRMFEVRKDIISMNQTMTNSLRS